MAVQRRVRSINATIHYHGLGSGRYIFVDPVSGRELRTREYWTRGHPHPWAAGDGIVVISMNDPTTIVLSAMKPLS